jgi:hypothetical protein
MGVSFMADMVAYVLYRGHVLDRGHYCNVLCGGHPVSVLRAGET